MKVTDYTRKALAGRRERRDMERAGYRLHETDWEVLRGHKFDQEIVDVRISFDRKHVWTKLGKVGMGKP